MTAAGGRTRNGGPMASCAKPNEATRRVMVGGVPLGGGARPSRCSRCSTRRPTTWRPTSRRSMRSPRRAANRAHGRPAQKLPRCVFGRVRAVAPARGGRRPLLCRHRRGGRPPGRGKAAHQPRQHRRARCDRRRAGRGGRGGHPYPYRGERGFARCRAGGARRSCASGEAGPLGCGLRAPLRGPAVSATWWSARRLTT